MLQVKTFLVPQQEEEANKFLATFAPDQQFFNKDTVIFFYDNGVEGHQEQLSEFYALLKSSSNSRFQLELALHVMEAELADTPTNMTRYNELEQAIKDTHSNIATSDLKADFVRAKIAELQG